MQRFSVGVLFILMAVAGFAKADTQPSPPVGPDGGTPNPLVVGKSAVIQGQVRFEEHHTIIPLAIIPLDFCIQNQNAPCVRSRPYWSVILDSDSNHFEIDQRFAVDQTTAPDSVDLAGQTIRQGQVIKVQGTVEYAGNGYYILGSVRNADLVIDYQTTALPNWSCRAVVDRDTEIEAHVWYAGAGPNQNERYALNLTGSEDSEATHHFFPLVALDNAQGFSSGGQIVYQGQSGNESVQLVIDPSAANNGMLSTDQLPGHLKFSLPQAPQEHSRIQAQGDFAVVCGRTR